MGAPIVHIEFRSADFTRTAEFYARLFDWKTQQNAAASYMKLDNTEGPSGGWVRADLVQAPAPIPYLVVDDLPAKMAEVEQAGGRVLVGSMPFAGGGEVGLFADPDGNVVGLWMRKKGAPAAAPAGGAAPAVESAAPVAKKAPAPPTAAKKAAAPAKPPKPAKPAKKK
jgi:predicted enzyme related to lactoylglutathione lyase